MSIWKKRINDLETEFGSLIAVADLVGIPVTTLSDLKSQRSKSPRYENAMKLEKLHREACGKRAA